jgi:trehalose 6-phosphate phosphatase
MLQPDFAGARPLFVGDDLTDEDAFQAAAELGGGGILVGPERETAARWRLDDVSAVSAWLGEAAS